jgi:hypothetical protein
MRRGWVVGVAAVAVACTACGGGGTHHAAPTTCPPLSPQSIAPSSPAAASTTKPSCLLSTSTSTGPAGEHWTGTVDMTQHETGDYGDCSKSQKGQVDFVLDSTGKVKGTATGDWMNNEAGCNPTNPKASFSGSGPWQGVHGRRIGQEFQLTFYSPAAAADLALPVTVPIVSPNTASAQGTDLRQSSASGPIYRTYSINLTCTNC